MNLISENLKLAARKAMKDLFDSFSRDTLFRFYKPNQETAVVFDPNYIADFEQSVYFENYTKTPNYADFKVRIWYLDRQDHNTFITGGQDLNIKMSQQWNRVRIQMEEDAYLFSKNCTLFVIGEERYKLEEPIEKIGILNEFQFYELILHKVN